MGNCWRWCGGTETGPPGQSGDSGTDVETVTVLASEPREWRRSFCNYWPCFRLARKSRNNRNRHTCLRPRGAPLCLGEAAYRMAALSGDRPKPGPGRAAEMAPRRVWTGALVHTTHTFPRRAGGERCRPLLEVPPCGGRRAGSYSRETRGPTWKAGVTSWPGVRSLMLPQGGARYSIVGGKGLKLGHPPEPLRTLDFDVPPEWLECPL